MIDRMQIARARAALPKAIRRWIYDPNITLVGLGWPEKNGQLDEGQIAIRFHVRNKFEQGLQLEYAIESKATHDEIPEEIDGIPTDVVQARYKLHQFWMGWNSAPANQRAKACNPIQCGVSIGSERSYGAGTLGGLVRDRQTGEPMCLSNWHVLVGDWGVRPPQRIFQPGRLDGGNAANTFAILKRDAMNDNLDAAVASVYGERQLVNKQMDLWPVHGTSQAQPGMIVTKSGYKTKITQGRVTVINSVAKLRYKGQMRLIRNVFVIDEIQPHTPVSDAGDSGSLWLDPYTRDAVGLHFAGSNQPEQALAMDIQAVLDALQVDLITG